MSHDGIRQIDLKEEKCDVELAPQHKSAVYFFQRAQKLLNSQRYNCIIQFNTICIGLHEKDINLIGWVFTRHLIFALVVFPHDS